MLVFVHTIVRLVVIEEMPWMLQVRDHCILLVQVQSFFQDAIRHVMPPWLQTIEVLILLIAVAFMGKKMVLGVVKSVVKSAVLTGGAVVAYCGEGGGGGGGRG